MSGKHKTIGILYSNEIHTTATLQDITEAVRLIKPDLGNETDTKPICADTIKKDGLENIDILVNILGSYYPETGWQEILGFYKAGGIILNIGIKPFSIPYSVQNEEVYFGKENTQALHSLHVIDEYVKAETPDSGMKLKLLNPRYNFIEEMYNNGEFPEMREVYAINYHLAENTPDVAWPDEVGIIDSQLDTICGWFDSQDRLKSVPITRIDHYNRGSLIFLNFTPSNEGFYSSPDGRKLLSGIIASASDYRFNMSVEQEYARYYQWETPKIQVSLKMLDSSLMPPPVNEFRLEVYDVEQAKLLKEFTFNNVIFNKGVCSENVSISGLDEGFYKVSAEFSVDGKLQIQKSTGFYKISDQAVRNVVEEFKPIMVDIDRAPDFCLQDGKIFPMHGTTYFTTDVYRRCFIKLNAFQCDLEMKNIKAMGFNILRTGNWQAYLDFYDMEGNIKEKSLRALDAFFFTAARYGLPVQFVLGAYVFNPWDRNKCPIHNPEATSKTIAAFSSFAQRYSQWPNVQVDALNEPSYSIAGKWTPARPSGDEYERKNWIGWLKRKYNGDLSQLRETWGISSEVIKSFDEIDVPEATQFSRQFDRKDFYVNYPSLTDFYYFARESYSNWVAKIRSEVKSRNEQMLFMMGRDESLRIPSQQFEAYKKNFDIINWHQWHKDSFIFAEYMLNRVRSIPCCAQEMGVYHYDDARGNMRISEEQCSHVLEKKLLYSFGNWIQWQLNSDPYMLDNCEIALGLLRADKSETPHMNITRLLMWIENKMSQYMPGRNEDAVKTLTIHPSNLYYSVDSPFGGRGILKSIIAFHYHLKMQTDMVLEHAFRRDNPSQVGNPDLIVFPAALMISQPAWDLLVELMKEGKTVLLSGYADIDEYWSVKGRFEGLGIQSELKNISGVEKVKIGDKYYYSSFRECVDYMNPGKALSKVVFKGETENTVKVFKIGKGKLIHCPVPLELGDSIEPVAALYHFAKKEAGISNKICQVENKEDLKPNILLYPISYKDSTLYTVVNEGEDDNISFVDLASGAKIELKVKGQRGCKFWLDKQGELLGAYVNDRLKVSGTEIIPNGDLSICKEKGKWLYFTGQREKAFIEINGEKININR